MTALLHCPRCSVALSARRQPGGMTWRCASCDGFALNLAVVRSVIGVQPARDFWALARVAPEATLGCPSCRRPVREIEYTQEFTRLSIDVCVGCQLVWLDRGELEALPRSQVLKQQVPRPKPPAPTDLALASRDRGIDIKINVLDVVTDGLWFITTMFD